jgi:predicted nucleic acid-binding protein
MTTYALDTNIISYFLKNDAAIVQKINEEKDKQNKFVIPHLPLVTNNTKHFMNIERLEIINWVE